MAKPQPTNNFAHRPSVSVLLSIHNGAAYIAEAIESILSQTYKDFELLIKDDASTDRTAELIKTYSDERIHISANSVARGLTHNLNAMIREARGTYLVRMDHDDICHKYRFEKQVAFLDRHPTFALVGSEAIVIDSHGKHLHRLELPHTNDEIRAYLCKGNCIVHPSTMLRREAVMKIGAYDESFPYAQDYDLWLRLSEEYSLANLREPLLFYRVHNGQISSTKLIDQSLCAHRAIRNAELRRAISAGRSELRFIFSQTVGDILGRESSAGHLLHSLSNDARVRSERELAIQCGQLALRHSPLSPRVWKLFLMTNPILLSLSSRLRWYLRRLHDLLA